MNRILSSCKTFLKYIIDIGRASVPLAHRKGPDVYYVAHRGELHFDASHQLWHVSPVLFRYGINVAQGR